MLHCPLSAESAALDKSSRSDERGDHHALHLLHDDFHRACDQPGSKIPNGLGLHCPSLRPDDRFQFGNCLASKFAKLYQVAETQGHQETQAKAL